jgi:hypothetical protein
MNDIVSPWRYTTDLRASNQEKNVFLGQTPSEISKKWIRVNIFSEIVIAPWRIVVSHYVSDIAVGRIDTGSNPALSNRDIFAARGAVTPHDAVFYRHVCRTSFVRIEVLYQRRNPACRIFREGTRVLVVSTAGGNVTVTWSDIASRTPGDWIGLYVPGSSDSALIARTWVYVNCPQAKGSSGIASGSCSLQIPVSVAAGTYELRLFSNNSLWRLGKSNPITIN